MLQRIKNILIGVTLWGIPLGIYAQEETGSAELFLEEYTDQFQECFFEALKQKGIGNYDKAINQLLKCREFSPNQLVINYELARAYLADKQYLEAQDFALRAINAQPENIWVLNTLLDVIKAQGNDLELIKEQVPEDNKIFKKNLASLYFERKEYAKAQKVLKELPNTVFKEQLERKIGDSLLKQRKVTESTKVVINTPENPLDALRLELEALKQAEQFEQLETRAEEALESYPTQPWIYYLYGSALFKNGKAAEASSILESALDFLLDDVELQQKIYQELVVVFKALGNTSKANMYLSKVKTGS